MVPSSTLKDQRLETNVLALAPRSHVSMFALQISLGKRRQDDCYTSGRLIIKTSAGRVCGASGSKLADSRRGLAPARTARRWTTLRKHVCICCLCPCPMHPMQWWPCRSRFCWQKEHAIPSSKILTPNRIERTSRNAALESKVSWLWDGVARSQASADGAEKAVKRAWPHRSVCCINPPKTWWCRCSNTSR